MPPVATRVAAFRARLPRRRVAQRLTWNVNVPIVRITPRNAGHSRNGGQTGWTVSSTLPWNVPVHHDLLPTGASVALTRAPPRDANTL